MAVSFVPAAALLLMVVSTPAADTSVLPAAAVESAGPGEPTTGVLNLPRVTFGNAAAQPAGSPVLVSLPPEALAAAAAAGEQVTAPALVRPVQPGPPQQSFRWMRAFNQTMLFTSVQNFARLTRPQVWEETVEGPFFDDWFKAAAGLFDNNWSDGNKFVTNYIAHPMGGAVYAFIARDNSKYRDLRPGDNGYVAGVFKSMAWAAVASLNHEIGPISEASIGNIGLDNPDQQAWIDPVITPTFGGLWMVLEDVVQQKVLSKIQGRTTHAILHCFLNPSRTMAHMMEGRLPWAR